MGDQYQFFQNYKHSLSLADMDSNIDFLNHFLNPNHSDMSTLNSQNLMMGFPQDHTMESLPAGFFIQDHTINPFMSAADHVPMNANMMIMDDHHVDRKRKSTVEISGTTTPESSSANTCAYNSSPQASDNASRKTNRGKKSKSSGIRDEKPGEVIHVRAKRGQATDSHSLAERVRRGKINERLRCLQDIVPGCYKTMGMAVMLDEIINYVQSLQNQVEFLSMKLTAASTFHDFNNSTTSAIDAMQAAKSTFDAALKAENASNQVQGFQQMKINYHPPSNTHPPNHISFLPQ